MRILIIDIDTLRPDHLGCYGYHRNTSPNIDSIAEKGIVFIDEIDINPEMKMIEPISCFIVEDYGNGSVYFELNSAKKNIALKNRLEKLVKTMKKYPTMKIEIRSHCDFNEKNIEKAK